jgi:glycine cleavage system H protein
MSSLPSPHGDDVRYRRNRFSTRLPAGYRYSRAHFWLSEEAAGRWRVGLTSFATRMLGDIVEFDFEVEPLDEVRLAQTIGWIEGFKATSDLIAVASGRFAGRNPAAAADPALICARPFADGWLYEVDGQPDPGAVDVHGYAAFLDASIDKMLEKPWQSPGTADSRP